MRTYKLNENKFKKFLKSEKFQYIILGIVSFAMIIGLFIILIHIRFRNEQTALDNFNSQFEIMITDKDLNDYNLEKLKAYKSGYFKEKQYFNEELFLEYIQQIDFDFWYDIKDILKGK